MWRYVVHLAPVGLCSKSPLLVLLLAQVRLNIVILLLSLCSLRTSAALSLAHLLDANFPSGFFPSFKIS